MPSFNHSGIAAAADEIRFFVTPGRKAGQTEEDFKEEYEVVHAALTAKTADLSPACRQYYQIVGYENSTKLPSLQDWDHLPSLSSERSVYRPAATTRHIWSSLQKFRDAFNNTGYQDETAGIETEPCQHIFCRLDQYGAVLTPIARLARQKDSAAFVDVKIHHENAEVHALLSLGNSDAGVSHEEIYSAHELRRTCMEFELRSKPDLGSRLLHFAQNGKMLVTP
ncbi:hypothetical protein N7522_002990 [Penicillium canescens]|nr:hypothetical protein N7522_002990 [Penicillium canescens]